MGSIRGIPIRIHWSFLLIIVWSAYNGSGIGGWSYVAYSVFLTCLVFVCVLLHELGHALMAQRFGVSTRSITLLPVGGVAALNRIPERPREEFLIAIAGPMVNVVIAGVLLILLGWPENVFYQFGQWTFRGLGGILIYVNIVMIVFNLIPAFPMDGGRIFRSLLACWFTYAVATSLAAAMGQIIAVLMFVTGLIDNPILCLIGLFVFMSARTENEMVQLRVSLEGKTVRDIMNEHPSVLSPEDPLPSSGNYIVVNGLRVVGVIPAELLAKRPGVAGGAALSGEIMVKPTILLSPDMPVLALCQLVVTTSQLVYPVIEQGVLVGEVNRSMVMAVMRNRRVQPVGYRNESSREEGVPSRPFIDIG